MPTSRIAVIESRWWEGYNSSIRGIFDLVSDIHDDSYHEYEYEMVGTTAALEESIFRLSRSTANVLFIGTHGSTKNLTLHGKTQSCDAVELGNMLSRADNGGGRGFRGVYVGACEFGTQKTAECLMKKSPRLDWVAGFGAEVHFLESSALDLLFFDRWRRCRGTPKDRIQRVAKYIKANVLELCKKKDIQFSIFAKDAAGNIVDLVRG